MLNLRRDSWASWLVLICVFCSQLMLGGICLNGGLFYIIFRQTFGSNAVTTSWLCSMPITLWFFASPVGSFLTNRFGYRKCSLIGAVIAALGISLSYLATGIGFLFVTHGFLTGLGFGINYTGGMAAINAYFDKYKTVALGLASVGHNLGLVLYAEWIVFLDEAYSWRGMMLINGGIAFNMCAFSIVMMHSRRPSDESRETTLTSDDEDKSEQKLTLKSNDSLQQQKKRERDLSQIEKQQQTDMAKKRSSSLNLSVFKKLTFICFCISNIFVNVAQGIYILHLPSYSQDVGFTENDFGVLWLVYGISNVVGKVVYSILGQHPRVNSTVLYSISLTMTGVAMGLTPIFLTNVGILITAGCVGFFYCVTGALIQAVIYNLVGYERFADGIGMSLPFKATGNLVGGPLAGVLFATSGTYTSSFYLAGISMVASSAFMIYPIIDDLRASRRKQKSYVVCEKLTVHPTEIVSLMTSEKDKNVILTETRSTKEDQQATQS